MLGQITRSALPVLNSGFWGWIVGRAENRTSHVPCNIRALRNYFDTTDIYKISKPWRYAAEVDYRIEPISVNEKRFLTDEASPLIPIVKQEGVEITDWIIKSAA